jgi:hypothetical protein
MLNFDDYEIYMMLVDVCKTYAVCPSSSLESENFFRHLLTQYAEEADPANISQWLQEQITKYFIAVGERPKWIQNPEWPFADGKPMIFVGQIDLSVQNEVVSKIYHDDTSLYLFVGQKVRPVVIIQQF